MYFGGRLEDKLSGHLESSLCSRFEGTLYGSLKYVLKWVFTNCLMDVLKDI